MRSPTLVVCLAACSAAHAQCQWTHLGVSGPVARATAAMAHDAVRHTTILFGGYSNNAQFLGDTWAFSGSSWVSVPVQTAPPPRAAHAMVFDAARGVIVLYGGYNAQSRFGDTWLWDGSTWAQALVSGPPGRSGVSLA